MMKRGEHGGRGIVKARILVNIIGGIDTYDGLKGEMRKIHFVIPAHAPAAGQGSEFGHALPPFPLEIKDEGTSPKDIHYHLMNRKYGLVAMGILAKKGDHYRLRTRSVREVVRIIELLLSLEEFQGAYKEFFDAYTRGFGMDSMSLVNHGDAILSGFMRYLAAFFNDNENLEDFVKFYFGFYRPLFSQFVQHNDEEFEKEYWFFHDAFLERFVTYCLHSKPGCGYLTHCCKTNSR